MCSRKRPRLRRNAVHQVTITNDGIGVLVDDVEFFPVNTRGQVRFRQCNAHAHTEALTERPCSGLNTAIHIVFRMAGSFAVPLSKALQFAHRHIVAGEVQQGVQQCGPVTGGEDEAIAVEPTRILGIVAKKPVPEYVGHGCGTQR